MLSHRLLSLSSENALEGNEGFWRPTFSQEDSGVLIAMVAGTKQIIQRRGRDLRMRQATNGRDIQLKY